MSADVLALFECPTCFNYVKPPILQCQRGHLVCCNCHPKLSCCPTCHGPLGYIRNLAMEKVANIVVFPKRHSNTNDRKVLSDSNQTVCDLASDLQPYLCPSPGASCKWQGELDQVMQHLRISHNSITILQGEDVDFLAVDINLPGVVDWVMMQSCFNHNFMLVLEKQEKVEGHPQFFAIVQLIGSQMDAENFAYRLELNGPRRKLTWESKPQSICKGLVSAIMSNDCLVFDTSLAQLCSNDGNLSINVTISCSFNVEC